jgi:hypothetical protein
MRLQRMPFIDRRETDQGAPVPRLSSHKRRSGAWAFLQHSETVVGILVAA